jgi:hypothetical protein
MKFDFELSELEWQNKMELGNGRFAKVYKSKLARNNRPIAIKVINSLHSIELLVKYNNKHQQDRASLIDSSTYSSHNCPPKTYPTRQQTRANIVNLEGRINIFYQ